jgi:hypothetical protein
MLPGFAMRVADGSTCQPSRQVKPSQLLFGSMAASRYTIGRVGMLRRRAVNVTVFWAVMRIGMISRTSCRRSRSMARRALLGRVSRMARPMPCTRGERPVESLPMRALSERPL